MNKVKNLIAVNIIYLNAIILDVSNTTMQQIDTKI